jgi:hypothetical protein
MNDLVSNHEKIKNNIKAQILSSLRSNHFIVGNIIKLLAN